jgi:hypothetical protein
MLSGTMEDAVDARCMNCRRCGVAFHPAHVAHLRSEYYVGRRLQMRACHPRDLIDQIVSLCRYQQRPAEITPELLDTVCQSYFLDDGQSGETHAR